MTCIVDQIISRPFEVPPPNSTSNSAIVFGTYKRQDVVLKLRVEGSDKNNALDVEAELYEFIRDKLSFWSPHFLVPVAVGSCSDKKIERFRTSKREEEKELYKRWIAVRLNGIAERTEAKEFNELIKAAKKGKKPLAEYVMNIDRDWKDELHDALYVLTPKVNGMTVEDFLSQRADKLPLCTVQDLLLQYAQALSAMASFKMTNYDMHFGNAFVEILEEPITLSYHYPRKAKMMTRTKLIIYDWDHGFRPGGSRNLLTDLHICKAKGECSKYTEKWDWYTVLTWFLYMGKKHKNYSVEEFETLLGKLYDPPHDKTKAGNDAHFSHACQCTRAQYGECVACKPKNLKSLISPKDYFNAHVAKAT